MLKEILPEQALTILKHVVLISIFSAVFILYIPTLNKADLEPNGVGVITGGIHGTVPVPVPEANQQATLVNSRKQAASSKLVSSEAQLAFETAHEAVRQGDFQSAQSDYARLISRYPGLPEPYANLASLQAKNGQLAEARATLLQGLRVNKGYAALFSNLQRVQGALAANAYKKALSEQGEAITKVALPMLESLILPDAVQQGDGLNQTLQPAKQQRPEEASAELPAVEQQLKSNN